MYPKLEIYEPGLAPAILSLEQRANADRIITIGRAIGTGDRSHVGIRRAPRLISRYHCSLRLNPDFSVDLLDGTFIDGEYSPSNNGVWLDGKRIEQDQWIPIRPEANIRLGNPRQPELQNFVLRLTNDSTDSGIGSISTVSFGAHQIWQASRLSTEKGCMLLRLMPNRTTVVLAIDGQSEVELGAQPGELTENAGAFTLESLVHADEHRVLKSQVEISLGSDTSSVGIYTHGDQEFRLTTARRLVEGEFFLLGFVEGLPPKKSEGIAVSPTTDPLSAIVAELLDPFRDQHPVWIVILLLAALALYLVLSA